MLNSVCLIYLTMPVVYITKNIVLKFTVFYWDAAKFTSIVDVKLQFVEYFLIYTAILLIYRTKRILWCMHLKHTPGMRKVKIKTNVIGQIRSWKLVYTPTDHLAKDKGISGCFFYFKDYIEIWGVGQVWRSFCLPAHTYLQKGERC